MLHLEKLMVALEYDMKEFLRIIYNTQTFQREAPSREITAKDSKDETMPPEVKWVIAGPNPNFRKEVLLLTFIKVLFFPECQESNFGIL